MNNNDQLPANEPRVLADATIEIRQGYTVPVLAQPSTLRLIVLNSTALGQVAIGQQIVLHLPEQNPQQITVEAIDRSSLIVRYTAVQPPSA